MMGSFDESPPLEFAKLRGRCPLCRFVLGILILQMVMKPFFFFLLILILTVYVLVSLWSSPNSSYLCVCPPVNIIEGITAFPNESSLCFSLNLHARLPSAWLLLHSLYLSHQFLSSAAPSTAPTSCPAPPSSSP